MSDSAKPASLADRIAKPGLDASSASFSPRTSGVAETTSWADEVASPIGNPPALDGDNTAAAGSSLGATQLDGQVEPLGGSGGSFIDDVQYDVEVTLTLEEMQNQEANPLYSAHSFEELGLSKEILQGCMSMNFKKPSKIQEKTLPLLLRNPPTNMIAQSQSGTGKTAAFVLTILSRIDYTKPEQPQALCLAPSRELARQIEGVVRSLGAFVSSLTIQAAVPGSVERGARVKAMIVVGTPGTVMDLIKRRQLDASDMKVLCLDEADNMLDQQGLGDQCLRVKAMIPAVKQTLLFSATFPSEVMEYAERFAPNAVSIKLQRNDMNVAGIKQMYIDCPSDEGKYEILAKLYGLMTIGSSIIFVKQRSTADKIANRLQQDGHQVAAIHGAFEGGERDFILEQFRKGLAKVLITTNVLARGIDVSAVSMVINYDIPMKGRSNTEADPETYLHRIGRTGRFGRVGVSISFVFDRQSFNALDAIARHYGIELIRLDADNWESTERTVKGVIKSSRAGVNFDRQAQNSEHLAG